MAQSTKIRFRDLTEREDAERVRLERRLSDLTTKALKRGGAADNLLLANLPSDERQELEFLLWLKEGGGLARLKESSFAERVEPLFIATRDLFNEDAALLGDTNMKVGNFDKEGRLHVLDASGKESAEFEHIVKISLVLGILMADGVRPPRITVSQEDIKHHATAKEGGEGGQNVIVADKSDRFYFDFVDAFYRAIGEARKSEGSGLAEAVLSILDDEGDPTGYKNKSGEVECFEYASVTRCLFASKVTKPLPQLHRRVTICLNKIQNVGGEDRIDEVSISMADLTSVTDYQIKPDNVRLMGPILCSSMFEELKVFQVLDKLVELSQNGMLTIGEGEAGKMLYLYWKNTPNRISESERRNIYSTTLGIPGGDGGGSPNREFNDLWLRFISAVSSLVRQRTADQILRTNLPASIGQQQVRKAARDLAMNLSARGYGMTYYLAKDLNVQINDIIRILGDQEIRSCFGASNMWQVIDQVATLELGGARNSARYSSMASSGAIIIAWLATNVNRYNKVTSAAVINVDEVVSLDPPTSNEPTKTPTDYDLVNACELWLADTATSDLRIEELSQPREAPMMTSRPVQIPSIARDMLESAGVAVPGFGLGAGITRRQ